MDEKLKHAKTVNFAEEWVEKWIRDNVDSGTATQKSAQIQAMLKEKFSHLKWLTVVYPPKDGPKYHATNFNIKIFG